MKWKNLKFVTEKSIANLEFCDQKIDRKFKIFTFKKSQNLWQKIGRKWEWKELEICDWKIGCKSWILWLKNRSQISLPLHLKNFEIYDWKIGHKWEWKKLEIYNWKIDHKYWILRLKNRSQIWNFATEKSVANENEKDWKFAIEKLVANLEFCDRKIGGKFNYLYV